MASILKAASRVIAKDGFEGASVRAMAAKGGIGLSGIYYYFSGKDELLYAIQHYAFSTLVSSLNERLAQCEPGEASLRAIIENHFQFFVDNADEFRVCVHEIDSLSGKYFKDVLKVRQEYFRLVREAVDQVLKGSQHETDMATFFLFGSLNWVYMWFDPRRNADIDKVTSQFLNVFLNGVNRSQAS